MRCIYIYIYIFIHIGIERIRGPCTKMWNVNWIIILVKDTVGYTCYIHIFNIFNTLECTIKKQPLLCIWYAGCTTIFTFSFTHRNRLDVMCFIYFQLPRFLVSLANKFLQICVLFSYSFPSTFYFSLTIFLILSSLSR